MIRCHLPDPRPCSHPRHGLMVVFVRYNIVLSPYCDRGSLEYILVNFSDDHHPWGSMANTSLPNAFCIYRGLIVSAH